MEDLEEEIEDFIDDCMEFSDIPGCPSEKQMELIAECDDDVDENELKKEVFGIVRGEVEDLNKLRTHKKSATKGGKISQGVSQGTSQGATPVTPEVTITSAALSKWAAHALKNKKNQ